MSRVNIHIQKEPHPVTATLQNEVGRLKTSGRTQRWEFFFSGMSVFEMLEYSNMRLSHLFSEFSEQSKKCYTTCFFIAFQSFEGKVLENSTFHVHDNTFQVENIKKIIGSSLVI